MVPRLMSGQDLGQARPCALRLRAPTCSLEARDRSGRLQRAHRANGRRRPWAGHVEAQMRGVLRFPSGGVGLHGVDPQAPRSGGEVDCALKVRGDAVGREPSMDDVGHSSSDCKRKLEAIEGRAAGAHVARHVDRPALALSQRLLEIDPGDRPRLSASARLRRSDRRSRPRAWRRRSRKRTRRRLCRS